MVNQILTNLHKVSKANYIAFLAGIFLTALYDSIFVVLAIYELRCIISQAYMFSEQKKIQDVAIETTVRTYNNMLLRKGWDIRVVEEEIMLEIQLTKERGESNSSR